MAASREGNELTSLEAARARLEAALAGDEHWRALQQSPGQGQGEEAEASAARRARNTRLKMALAENPLYQAWKHLGEAIAALRESGADAELPGEIARLLRDHASQAAPPPADEPAEPPPKPKPAAPADKRPAEVDGAPRPRPHPNGRAAADPEEASVSFVRREPLLPSAQLPADLGSERASALFERLRGLEEEQALAATEGAFTPPKDADEAEVSIVSEEDARLRREADERAGTIRRLRKALSGD